MKFTERFFRIPIKVYDGWEVAKAAVIESKKLEENPENAELESPSWMQCWQRVNPHDILSWCEYFSRDIDVETAKVNGPELTCVDVKGLGELTCLWTMKEFERRLDEFYEKIYNNSFNIPENK